MGGGLVRSIGGREQLVALRRGRERWVSDERVLGGSEFVLGVQEAAEARAALAWSGRVELALATRRVAEAAGVSDASVMRLLGRAILAERKIDPTELIEKCVK